MEQRLLKMGNCGSLHQSTKRRCGARVPSMHSDQFLKQQAEVDEERRIAATITRGCCWHCPTYVNNNYFNCPHRAEACPLCAEHNIFYDPICPCDKCKLNSEEGRRSVIR